MVPETVRRLEQSYRSCERASRRLCPPGRSPTTRHQGLEISRQGSSAHPGVIQGGRLRSDRDLASCDGQGDGERDPKDERSDEEREDHPSRTAPPRLLPPWTRRCGLAEQMPERVVEREVHEHEQVKDRDDQHALHDNAHSEIVRSSTRCRETRADAAAPGRPVNQAGASSSEHVHERSRVIDTPLAWPRDPFADDSGREPAQLTDGRQRGGSGCSACWRASDSNVPRPAPHLLVISRTTKKRPRALKTM